MPEGPEVRRAADRIEKAVAGKSITAMDMEHPALEGAERWLYGAVLQRVQTFGKGFALCFDCGYAIYVHLQLYGVWRTGRLPQTKPTRLTFLAGEDRAARRASIGRRVPRPHFGAQVQGQGLGSGSGSG